MKLTPLLRSIKETCLVTGHPLLAKASGNIPSVLIGLVGIPESMATHHGVRKMARRRKAGGHGRVWLRLMKSMMMEPTKLPPQLLMTLLAMMALSLTWIEGAKLETRGSCKHGKAATDDAADVPADLNLPIASVDDSCAEVVTSDCPEHWDASEPTVKQDKEAESGAACDGAEQDYLLASAISGQLRHDTTRVTSRTEDKTSTASEEDDFIETLRAALQAAAEQGQLGKESINDLVISRLRDEALRGELCVDSVAEVASDAILLDCG